MGSGTKPAPRPRSCASSLARIVGTVNTSCPASKPTRDRLAALHGVRHRDGAVLEHDLVLERALERGERVVRRDGEHELQLAQDVALDAGGRAGLEGHAQRRGRPGPSSRPPACRTAIRRACAGGSPGASAKNACASSITVERETTVSTAIVSSDSQPVATRRTRLATASISCSSRPPSRSSSLPASVRRAWRELRSNSSTSSASSIWRMR